MAVEDKAQVQAPAPKKARSRAEILSMLRKIWPWFFLILMVAVFTISTKTINNTDFITPRTIQSILVYATQILLLALGETYIIIAAGIDLSLGYTIGLAAVIAAQIMQTLYMKNTSPIATIGLGMLGGTLICIIPGWVNGWLVAKIKVPPFISTLGLGYAIYGYALHRTGGYPVAKQPPYSGPLGNGSVLYYWPGHGVTFFHLPPGSVHADLTAIVPILPNVVLVAILVTILCWFILAKTQFGQHIYAIGGNFQASVRAGIPVSSTLTRVYILAAVLAGIGGSLWATRFTSGDANAGTATLLFGIAAVFIGGASMFGGEGSIIGTVVGALIIATIQFGLVVLGMPPFYQYIAVGLVVIVAVIIDQFGRSL